MERTATAPVEVRRSEPVGAGGLVVGGGSMSISVEAMVLGKWDLEGLEGLGRADERGGGFWVEMETLGILLWKGFAMFCTQGLVGLTWFGQ